MKNVVKGRKGAISIPVELRFEEKVIRPTWTKCWLWNGATGSGGYPQIYHNGRQRHGSQVSWEIKNGVPFPPGKMACHECDNPGCVNPDHIWPGTMSENIKDCVAKGRHWQGQINKSLTVIACRKGHEMVGYNRKPTFRGGVCCRICAKEQYKKYYYKKKALLEVQR